MDNEKVAKRACSQAVRLDKLLSNRGYGSRKDVVYMLRGGRVLVAGELATSPAQKVDPAVVTVDGAALDPERLFLLMNKPEGCTCSHNDAGELVYDLLPERYMTRNPLVSTVGRLDRDTTGALLFTDDGAALHQLTSPKHHVAKVYEVWLESPLAAEAVPLLEGGTLVLTGEKAPLAPAQVEVLEEQHLLLTLTEGRFHQVKRMFEAVGNAVVRLHRRSFAGLGVEGLEPGAYRLLEAEEVAALLSR